MTQLQAQRRLCEIGVSSILFRGTVHWSDGLLQTVTVIGRIRQALGLASRKDYGTPNLSFLFAGA